MEHLADESAILQALYRFTHAQDRLDLATMASVLVPDQKIKFDLTKHFPDVGIMEGNAAEICNILYEASAGWTATQHPVYNPIVTIDNKVSTRAKVQAMVQAYHCLEIEGDIQALTVYATWYIEMEKRHEQWVIVGMAMERDMPIANVTLFQSMRARMESGIKRQPLTKPNA